MRPIATDKSDFEELRKAGQIYAVGLAFDSKARRLSDAAAEELCKGTDGSSRT